jgi:hypothetical protein
MNEDRGGAHVSRDDIGARPRLCSVLCGISQRNSLAVSLRSRWSSVKVGRAPQHEADTLFAFFANLY